MHVKKIVYIALFVFLGILLNLLAHGLLEYPFMILVASYSAYFETSWVWQNWPLVHRVVNVSLWTLGIVGGFLAGRHYWRVVYEQ